MDILSLTLTVAQVPMATTTGAEPPETCGGQAGHLKLLAAKQAT